MSVPHHVSLFLGVLPENWFPKILPEVNLEAGLHGKGSYTSTLGKQPPRELLEEGAEEASAHGGGGPWPGAVPNPTWEVTRPLSAQLFTLRLGT